MGGGAVEGGGRSRTGVLSRGAGPCTGGDVGWVRAQGTSPLNRKTDTTVRLLSVGGQKKLSLSKAITTIAFCISYIIISFCILPQNIFSLQLTG